MSSAAYQAGHMPSRDGLPWIGVSSRSPYFVDDAGQAWTPIGQNDAITWPDLQGLLRGKDVASVRRYLALLQQHKVTCLRVMLEYCQTQRSYFERPAGRFNPTLVRFWDELFALCSEHGLRVLLTPVDTFFMWTRWQYHPWNVNNGGPCREIRSLLLCPETRKVIKDRLSFCVDRWSGNGALFAWDLWNEIHPSYGMDSAACFHDFIADLSTHVRSQEQRLYGRTHPQTVSMFGPHLGSHPEIADAIYRHPCLDYASTHLYEHGSIDWPRNTIDAGCRFGRLVRECVEQVTPGRPYFDSEHGPIHSHKDRRITLPEPFDDEYFRHMQWAHLASGGAGGGMRWPNRKPHSLTLGMRQEQRKLAEFLPLLEWTTFQRQNISSQIQSNQEAIAIFGCADRQQAVLYLLRTGVKRHDALACREKKPLVVRLIVPTLVTGTYRVTAWDTVAGEPVAVQQATAREGELKLETPGITVDLALAIQREEATPEASRIGEQLRLL